jgi:hypothetical protein
LNIPAAASRVARSRAGYLRLADFRGLAARRDPAGKFRNAFVDKYVFA